MEDRPPTSIWPSGQRESGRWTARSQPGGSPRDWPRANTIRLLEEPFVENATVLPAVSPNDLIGGLSGENQYSMPPFIVAPIARIDFGIGAHGLQGADVPMSAEPK